MSRSRRIAPRGRTPGSAAACWSAAAVSEPSAGMIQMSASGKHHCDTPQRDTCRPIPTDQHCESASRRLELMVPVTLHIIIGLLCRNVRNVVEVGIVMRSQPSALVGGVWLMWLLHYNLSTAVAVEFIVLDRIATYDRREPAGATWRCASRPCRVRSDRRAELMPPPSWHTAAWRRSHRTS